MWAQLITNRLKPGKGDADVLHLVELLKAAEQPGSGLVRSIAMRDQGDPNVVRFLAVFESEEKARAREGDSRRQDALASVRDAMAEAFDGAPEFNDLGVLAQYEG